MLHQMISGALFDFLGYLTTRDERREIGASADAAPFPVLLKEWAESRGLRLEDAAVSDWRDLLAEQILPMSLDSGASLSIQSIGGHVTADGQDPKWGRDPQDVWPRELKMVRSAEGRAPVTVDYVHAESTARAALALMVEMKKVGEIFQRRKTPPTENIATLQQEFDAELARVRELLDVYVEMGDPGTFAATMVGDVVRRAEEAEASGSIGSVRHMLGELRGCQ